MGFVCASAKLPDSCRHLPSFSSKTSRHLPWQVLAPSLFRAPPKNLGAFLTDVCLDFFAGILRKRSETEADTSKAPRTSLMATPHGVKRRQGIRVKFRDESLGEPLTEVVEYEVERVCHVADACKQPGRA